MTYILRLIRFLLVFAVLAGISISAGQAQNPVVRIGIAMDGPWERNEEIRTTFEREITQLLQAEYDVRFRRALPSSSKMTRNCCNEWSILTTRLGPSAFCST